jgi:hypothetical protein
MNRFYSTRFYKPWSVRKLKLGDCLVGPNDERGKIYDIQKEGTKYIISMKNLSDGSDIIIDISEGGNVLKVF